MELNVQSFETTKGKIIEWIKLGYYDKVIDSLLQLEYEFMIFSNEEFDLNFIYETLITVLINTEDRIQLPNLLSRIKKNEIKSTLVLTTLIELASFQLEERLDKLLPTLRKLSVKPSNLEEVENSCPDHLTNLIETIQDKIFKRLLNSIAHLSPTVLVSYVAQVLGLDLEVTANALVSVGWEIINQDSTLEDQIWKTKVLDEKASPVRFTNPRNILSELNDLSKVATVDVEI